MPKTVLVTGATGHVGEALIHTLAGAGVRPRALVRDREKAARLLGDRAELVVGALGDPDALSRAVRGVDALFLACANVPDQVVLEQGVVDAARRARVGRLVKLSARGASLDADAVYWRRHAAIEDHLLESDVPAVVLRPSYFMTNLLAAATAVRDHGVLPAPAGTAAIAMVDPRDVAAVAARALLDGSVPWGVHTLHGPQALTYEQVAQHLAAVAGRDVHYADVPPQAAAEQMVAGGVPPHVAAEVLEVFARLRQGDDAVADTEVARLTGRPATTLAEFAARHASAFADLAVRA